MSREPTTRRRCAEHPHRPAADHCDRCRRAFCRDCLVRGRPELLCRACWNSAPEREAEAARRRGLRGVPYRLRCAVRERRSSVVAATILVAILALVARAAVLQAQTPEFRALVGQAIGRVGAAQVRAGTGAGARASGAGNASRRPTPNPTPAPHSTAMAMIGGFWVGDGASGVPYSPLVLVRDGGPNAPGWRTRTQALPDEIGFELREVVTLDRVAFCHTQTISPASWAKDVELILSASARDAGFVPVGRWALAQTTEPQEFSFRPTSAKFIRLRLLSRHGDATFTSLGAFAVGIQARDRGPLLPP